MNLEQLPFNLFDLAIVGVLVVGIFRGRKHGMSEELLRVLKWLVVIGGCSMCYEPVGRMLAQSAGLGLLGSFLTVYVGCALLILALFALFKHGLGGKLVGSDIFGRAEYPLGMASGLVRFSCMLIAALALLNARDFPQAEVKDMERFQNDVYGSNFFPTWHTAQQIVFDKSLSGPWIKEHLDFLLIKPTQPQNTKYHQQVWGASL